jgi:hypothetical protein
MTKQVEVDEFHGIGGAYVFENGVRRRVEEPTKDHPEGNAPRNEDGSLIEFPKPKKEKAATAPASAPAEISASQSSSRKGGGK